MATSQSPGTSVLKAIDTAVSAASQPSARPGRRPYPTTSSTISRHRRLPHGAFVFLVRSFCWSSRTLFAHASAGGVEVFRELGEPARLVAVGLE